MTLYPVERPLAVAVIALLTAELGANLVGYAKRPSAGGWQTTGTPTTTTPFKGYAVVYVGQTLPGEGDATDGRTDGVHGFQVSAFGSSPDQADTIRDRCREALLRTVLTVPGRACRFTELADGTNVRPDKDVTPWVFQADDRFTVYTEPA